MGKHAIVTFLMLVLSSCASVETYEGRELPAEQSADPTSYADSIYKASPITTLGKYNHDNRYAIHQNIDTLSRKLWKSKTQKIVRTKKTSTFRKNDVLELIDLNGDNYPEKYAYWGKGRSRDETQDFGFIYDLNNDAKIDYIVFYQGAMIGEDEANSFMFVFTFYHWIDTNYDGIIDTWVFPDVDLNGNGKIEVGTYAWLYDTNNDGKIDAAEYLNKDTIQTIDAENNVYKIKLMTGEKSREGIQKLPNKILTDVNSLIE